MLVIDTNRAVSNIAFNRVHGDPKTIIKMDELMLQCENDLVESVWPRCRRVIVNRGVKVLG